jgi:hypothetical protein
MAKGFNQSGLHILVWEVFRGTGRQTGRDLSKTITSQLQKRTLDSKSKFRRAMDKFQLTGTLKGSLNNVYKIIDLFEEEYTTTRAFLQVSWYLQDDVKLIEKKIQHLQRLVFTEQDERAYERCAEFWMDVRDKILAQK